MNKNEHYVLVNVNEEIVKTLARDLMEKTDMCCCEKCFTDVCAIALNGFYCNYVTSKQGETITNVINSAMDNKVEFVVAVSKAIELVKDNPKHVVTN